MTTETNSHHRAKLSNAQVRAMRSEYFAYVRGYLTMARKYGCGESTARDICTYRTRTGPGTYPT